MQTPSGPPPDQTIPSLVGTGGGLPLRARLRAMASRVRRFPERALHPMRRRRARQRVAAASPGSILVVCYGNVCRSPYAAMAIHRDLPELFRASIQVRSAGFVGPGRGSPSDAVRVAARLGVDLTAHRSELVSPENLGAADLVLVMDSDQRRAISRRFGKERDRVVILGDLDPEPIEKRAIRDPWNQPVEVFSQSYQRIDRCVASLVSAITRAAPAASD